MAEPLKVTTVNLNGIRAAHKRGFLDWVEQESPDILLMQEVRAPTEVTQDILGGSYQVFSLPCQIKGRAGVAVAVHPDIQVNAVVEGLPGDEAHAAHSGRWLEVDIDWNGALKLVSAYFHSGALGTPKQDLKMEHLVRIEKRMEELRLRGSSLVAGDFNVVRGESDIKNWKPNHNKSSGVLDEEIIYLNRWVESGWVDTVRHLAGDVQGPYSWWSWRGKAFDNNAGWRIDYQYATPDVAQRALDYSVFRASSWDERFSDHAPVTVRYAP